MIVFKALTEQNEWAWMDARAFPYRVEDSQGIVAYEESTSVIAGMVIMDNWTASSCSCHIAIDNPMCIRAGLIREASIHVHLVCNKRYMFGQIPASNPKALKFDLKLGFKEVARIPDAYAEGIDNIVVRMDRDENRWLPELIKNKAA